MYFIGNTCFPTKIVYRNKIHLYYAGIKKDYRLARLEPGDTIFFAAALNFTYVFLILTRVFSQQKLTLV